MLHPVPRENRYTSHNNFRHNYFSPSAHSSSSARRTPEQILQSWHSKLTRLPVLNADVQVALETLAKGEPVNSRMANALFNTLIYYEAYPVFVEAFEAWNNAMQTAKPGASASSFVSTLTLELPADWDPQYTVELQQAFLQIRAERVVVLAPPCLTFEHLAHLSPAAVPGTMPVPEAVNGCLVELIKGGITELGIRGTLNVHSSDKVSYALIGSRLTSIDLDPNL